MRTATTCHGNGCAAGTTPEVCPDCHGTGTVQVSGGRRPWACSPPPPPAPAAAARAGSSTSPARTAGGTGAVRKRKTIQVTIPAGIDNGQTISIRGQGHAGKNGGPAGDLLITITVRPHELFRREGTSVLCEAPITFAQAVLGAELEIPTIDGKVKYDPAGGHPDRHHLPAEGQGHSRPQRPGPGRPVCHRLYRDAPEPEPGAEGGPEEVRREPWARSNYEERKKFFKKFKK